MNKEDSKKLITTYIDGWKRNEVNAILSSLSENCSIVESHGPRFEGKQEVKQWVEEWIARKSKVIEWEIESHIHENEKSAITWSFRCNDRGTEHAISGASLIRFHEDRIAEIFEYMRTQEPYPGLRKEEKRNQSVHTTPANAPRFTP